MPKVGALGFEVNEPAVLARELRKDLSGSVSRVIVNDDDVELERGLLRKRARTASRIVRSRLRTGMTTLARTGKLDQRAARRFELAVQDTRPCV